jgi:RNA polymerase sigma-70 factor, ECF subfamily
MSEVRPGHGGAGGSGLSATALGEVFEGYRGMVVAVCAGVLGHSHLLADAVQEVFLKLVLSARDIRDAAKLGPWLGTVARNTAIDLLKTERRRSEPKPESTRQTPLDALIRGERQRAVMNAVMDLESDYREAILMRYLHSNSYRQIADALGVPVSTVETRLFRARRQLAGKLGAQ